LSAPRKVFLVGFMGAGKTSVGRKLASALEYPFVDLDEIVEAATRKTIRELFESEGEPAFRRRESSVLQSCFALDRAVVATGGGTFVVDECRRQIQESGVSIFLDVPFPVILSRLSGKAESRPLFRDPAEAFQLYSARLEFYKMADICLGVGVEETVEEIAERAYLALPFRNRD